MKEYVNGRAGGARLARRSSAIQVSASKFPLVAVSR